MSAKLRFYQRDCVQAQESSWFEFQRGVVKMPTGSGKTVCASVLTESNEGRTLFLADQEELCDQPLRVFQRVSGIFAGLEKAKYKASLESQVVIASVQSMHRKQRRERYPRNHFSRIIVDECHRLTDQKMSVCDYFEKALVSGVTATPFRKNLADLSRWFDTVSYKMEPMNFIELGFSPPEDIMQLPVEIDLAGVRQGMTPDGKDYKVEDCSHVIEPYFDVIAEMIKEHAHGRFGIAYLPLISTSKNFAACLRSHGITAHHVDGNSNDRDLIIEGFSRREFSWLCNAGVVSTGVDIPIADCFLCLRPTRSASWYQQARGRVWRVLPGIIDHLTEEAQSEERREIIAFSPKPNSLILDVLWQNDELGVQRPGDMYAESEYDARKIAEALKGCQSPQHALEIAKQVQADREAAVVKALETAAVHGARRTVAAPHVGALIGDGKLANYEPVAKWEMQRATDPQKSALAKFGVDPDSIPSKGAASAILNALFSRMRMGLATLKQVRFLKAKNERLPEAWKIKCIEGLTLNEASKLIDGIIKQKVAA